MRIIPGAADTPRRARGLVVALECYYGIRGECGWVGFLTVCFPYKSIPAYEKIAVGKRGPNATFDLFFLGLGWPWVGEFVGFV